MSRKLICLTTGLIVIIASLSIYADNYKTQGIPQKLTGTPQVIYPMDHAPKFAAEVACTVRMAGDAYWAMGSWATGDEIYKTYQDPSVAGIDCGYPFEIDAIAMQLQFAAAGTVWVSVDIEEVDSAQSLPSCPYPGSVIGLSEEWGFYIPAAGQYVAVIDFVEPVTVNAPYFCGFFFASDVTSLGMELILDNDPYLCVNWNDWGEGWVDLVENVYYDFPGNLVLYSIGRYSGSVEPDPATAIPSIVWPPDSSMVSGNVYLRTSELLDTAVFSYCHFEYENPSLGWTAIYQDVTAEVSLRNTMVPSIYNEGYSAIWSTGSLAEGWYKIRSLIYDDLGGYAADSIHVYLDNTPLKPEFSNPEWGGYICDSSTLTIYLTDEDVSFLQFEYRTAPDTISIDPPILLQSRYGDTDNDTLDNNLYSAGEYGEFYNAPAAIASLIRYFGNQGFVDLVKEGSLFQTDRQIVERLADSMKVRQNLGAEDDNFIWAVRDYFADKGDQFEIDLIQTITPDLLDYVMGFKQGGLVVALGQPYGIWLTITEFDLPHNSDQSYTVKILDSKTGSILSSSILYEPYPQIQYMGSYRSIDFSLGIYPSAETITRTIIGLDFNPSDGFSFYWDVGSIADGAYYVTATGTDNAAHIGQGVQRIYVGCSQGYVSGDANGDGFVNVSDAVWIVNYVFVGGSPPVPTLENGDANCDGFTNVSDAVWLVNYVFTGGPPPCNK
jgi:Dockerin type I domain